MSLSRSNLRFERLSSASRLRVVFSVHLIRQARTTSSTSPSQRNDRHTSGYTECRPLSVSVSGALAQSNAQKMLTDSNIGVVVGDGAVGKVSNVTGILGRASLMVLPHRHAF